MRKPMGVLALLIVVCAVVTANVGSTEVKLQVAMWINDMAEIAKTQALLDEYMATKPGVKLELIQQPWGGYHEKMIALSAGGLTPDVMVVERRFAPSFAHNGVIQPVEQWR